MGWSGQAPSVCPQAEPVELAGDPRPPESLLLWPTSSSDTGSWGYRGLAGEAALGSEVYE